MIIGQLILIISLRYWFTFSKKSANELQFMSKKKLVVLSGAGVSAESGIAIFRGSGGLWEGYDIMEVA